MAIVVIMVIIQLLHWVCVFLLLYKHFLLNKVILKCFLCFDFHLVTFLTYHRLLDTQKKKQKSHDAVEVIRTVKETGNSYRCYISSLHFFQLLRGLHRWRCSSSRPSPVLLDLQVSCSPTAPLRYWASENVRPRNWDGKGGRDPALK